MFLIDEVWEPLVLFLCKQPTYEKIPTRIAFKKKEKLLLQNTQKRLDGSLNLDLLFRSTGVSARVRNVD